MRQDYLTTDSALDYLRERYSLVLTLDALRNRIQRGQIQTRKYHPRGMHLITRGELDRWVKEKAA